MNVGMKWLATAVVTVSLLFSCRDAAAGDAPATGGAAAADPTVWGIYSQLPGTEWSGYNGNVTWLWGPDGTIVESRTFQMKSVIRPGAPGELVSVYGGGLHTYDGRIAADGSVLWIRRGRFLKMPSRVMINDGRFVEEMVKLDEASQVAKVNSIRRFEQTAGPKVAAVSVAPAAAASEPPQALVQAAVPTPTPAPTPSVIAAAPVDSPPAVSTWAPSGPPPSATQRPLHPTRWGVYAQLVGHSMIHSTGEQRWRMAPSGEAVLREVLTPDGTIVNVDVIEVVGPSLLGALRSSDCIGGVCSWVGQVGADGVVTWNEPNGAGGGTSDRDLSVEGRELVDFWKGTGKEEPWYADYPHLRPAPRRYPLTVSTAVTAAQQADSDRRTAGLEGAVAATLGKTLAQQQAQQEADALDRERRRRSQERVRSFNRAMGSLNGVLTQANDVATANEAASRASLDATLVQINAQAEAMRQAQAEAQRQAQQQTVAERHVQAPAQQDAPPREVTHDMQVAEVAQPQPMESEATASEPPAAATGKPLRFVMSISLRNQPGDKVNPTCYSNIVSRQGPPGWGAPGFLPPGSAEQARETVYGLKSAFIAQCRASGREITSDGNFNFQMNQMRGDEERLQGMRARYSEDVSVSL